MISSGELKKLIEKQEVVWGINSKGEVYKRSFHYKPCHKESFIKNFDYSKGDHLFTTREAAAWVAEVFATRTERFEPPYLDTLKGVKKTIMYSFVSKRGVSLRLTLFPADRHYEGGIYLTNGAYCVKSWQLDLKNWIEACKYCKELFTGIEEE